MTLPNLYGFATKELAQDATLAYLLKWADPTYRESHPRLHALGTELLRSLLQTQEVVLPPIETLCIKTQVDRIDIVVQINASENGVLLIIEDKVSAQEGPGQIEGYKKKISDGEKYRGQYGRLVAVYLKTGNESKASLPKRCGRFMRRDLLDVLSKFQDTGNTIVDDFRTHLQNWEDDTNGWKPALYEEWKRTQSEEKRTQREEKRTQREEKRTQREEKRTQRECEGFYAELEDRWWDEKKWCRREDSDGWGYLANPAGGFIGCWFGFKPDGGPNLYIQIHDALRLTVRLGAGGTNKVRAPLMYQVYQVLEALTEEAFSDIHIKKAGAFRGGGAAAVADVTFDGQGPWFAVDPNGVVNMDATIERLRRLEELLEKVGRA